MTTKNFAFLAALCCTVLVGGSATSQSTDPGQSVETARRGMRDINLGLATKEPMWVEGNTALFTVSESAQRADLNGDGDMEDESIAHVFDATTGRTRNLGLILNFFPFFKGRLLGFYASEFGSRDLNGDGDTNDGVLHVYDTVRRTLTNLRLSGSSEPFGVDITPFDGRRLVFGVNEESEGRDLNRDGDLVDVVPHIFDVETGRIQNTRLAVDNFDTISVVLVDRWIAVAVSERESATLESGQNRDLNGDGDLTDTVPHLFDTATGRVTNLRVTTGSFPSFRFGFNVGGGEGMLVVPELAQGADLNADNDLDDTFLLRVDLASGRVRNTRIGIGSGGLGEFSSLDFGDVVLREGLAVFNRLESGEGKDFNGDGDLDDTVLHTLSTRTGRLRSVDVQAVVLPSFSDPSRAVLFMSEQANGKDLNGDGDVDQFVVGLADLSGEPRVVSTGSEFSLASDDISNPPFPVDPFALQIREDLATFVVSEAQEANTDLNGDGDSNDFLLHIADLSTLKIVNTKLSGSFAYRSVQAPLLRPDNGRVVLPVREDREGRDLNRDGDMNDMVLQTVDVRSGRSRNSGFAVATVPKSSRENSGTRFRYIFEVPLLMRGQGFESALVREEAVDLNFDGDTNDLVLHFFDVATGKVTNTGFAVAMPERNELIESFFAFSGLDPGPAALAPLAPSEFQFLVGPRSGDGPGLGDAYTFIVSEAAQGNIDLNGDGDTDDTVVHATRLTDRDRDGRFDFAEEGAQRSN